MFIKVIVSLSLSDNERTHLSLSYDFNRQPAGQTGQVPASCQVYFLKMWVSVCVQV